MGLGAWPAFVKVRLPHALPQIFTGLKVAITLATVGAIIGEFVGSDRGLGYLLPGRGGRPPHRAAVRDPRRADGDRPDPLLGGWRCSSAWRIPWHVSRRGPLGAEGGL